MARFDVYAHPDAQSRRKTPFLLDIQNEYINALDTRIVMPMRAAASYGLRMRDLNPEFMIDGQAVVLDAAALAAVPARELRRRVTNLRERREDIIAALDSLIGAH